MKKIISIFMILVMIVSLCGAAFAAAPVDTTFTDTDNHPYEDAIEVLHALGMVNGDGRGHYYPDNSLSRAEAAAIIVRALYGEPTQNYPSYFIDVPAGQWYSNYVAVAYNTGIMNGYGDGRFGPHDLVTYDQVVMIVLNVLGYRNIAWPYGARNQGADLGLYTGTTVNDPAAACTRGFICQVLFNAFECVMLNEKGVPTTETFMDKYGIQKGSEFYGANDHVYVTYYGENGNNYNVRVSHTVTGLLFNIDKVYVNDTYYTTDTCVFYKNGVITDSFTIATLIPTNGYIKVSVVLYNKTVTAIHVNNDDHVYIPAGICNWTDSDLQAIVEKDKNYCAGTSVVTRVGANDYRISNDYGFGYVIDFAEIRYSDSTVAYTIKLNTGKTFTTNDFVAEIGQYVVYFYDYTGKLAGITSIG